MKRPPTMQSASTDESPVSADSADPHCALCGMSPAPTQNGVLRQLGAPPVIVTVCADADACVTRWVSARR